MSISEAQSCLDRQIWITKGARFNAYRRFMRKHYASILTISILTLYNIGLSILPASIVEYYLGEGCHAPASVLTSIFILVLSLLEVGKGYELKAERLHQNAMQLSELYTKYILTRNMGEEELKLLATEYHGLIKNCPENHSLLDDKKFRTEHPHEFGLVFSFPRIDKIQWVAKIKVTKPVLYWHVFLYHLGTYWLYLVLLSLPVALIFLRIMVG